MFRSIGLLNFLLFFIVSKVTCNPVKHNGEHIKPNSNTTIDNKAQLLNPFGHMPIDEQKIYLIGGIFVILFTFIKLGTSKEFNYCYLVRFQNCVYSDTKQSKRCTKHVTCGAGIFPESAYLIISGIIPAVIMLRLGFELDGTLDPKLVFKFLLIPIIMAAGWNTDKITFNRNVFTILWFAIIGTVVNAAILMPFFYFGSKSRWGIFSIIDMDLVNSGLYAILICAVDPVAVLSVFEAMHIDKLVYSVVFGESLLNDGVAVVFYNAFDGMRDYKNILFYESVGIVFVFFVYAFCISVVLATLMAFIISFVTKMFFHQQPIQFVVIIALNYLTYILGDSMKGSGILSLYFCVLMQRQYVQANLSYTSNVIIFHLLNQLALVAEGVIFILMGFTSFSSSGISKHTDIGFSLFLILICYVSRYPVVYGLGYLANIVRTEKLSYKKNLFIQSHGGLRGAIGFSLALTIDERYPNKHYYQSATALMVFFSVFILGATIKPLVNLCKIPIESHEEKSIFESLQDRVTERTKEGVKAIIGSTSLRLQWERYYTVLNNRFLKRLLMDKEALERNISHSGVVKLHRNQTIVEAQTMAVDHGSMLIKDAYKNGGDARIKMYKVAWNSFVNLESFYCNGSGNNALLAGSSVPDMAMLGQMMTRRDVDDQMSHHNLPEGMGRKFPHCESMIYTQKRKENPKVNQNHHNSLDYPHQAHIIDMKYKHSHQNDVTKSKGQNKSVTFNGVNRSGPESTFDLVDRQKLENLKDEISLFSIPGDNKVNQAYTNKAFEKDHDFQATEIRNRRPSGYDPFLGDSAEIIGVDVELPWQHENVSNMPQKSKESPRFHAKTFSDDDIEIGRF